MKKNDLVNKAVVVFAEKEKHFNFFKEQIEQLLPNTTWYENNYLHLFDSNHKTFVVEIENKPVSFCSFIISDNVADIDATATKQEFQKMGLARLCFEVALNYLKNDGINSVFLEVAQNNKPAKNFYETLGFVRQQKVIKNYYNDGQDALVYLLDLNNL